MLSLTKICILIAILLVAMEVRGANVKTPNEYQDIQMMEEEKEATGDSIDEMEENVEDEALINSIASWNQVLAKAPYITSQQSMALAPFTYNQDVISDLLKTLQDLLKSLKNCKQAVESLNSCKKGGEKKPPPKKPPPKKPPPKKPPPKKPPPKKPPPKKPPHKKLPPKKPPPKKPPPKEGGGTGKKPIEKVYNVNSCDELKKKHSTLKSGNYKLRIGGKEVPVYCHMGKLCGTVGGWTRLGYFHAHRRCPNGQFRRITKRGLRLCRINSNRAGCATASYSSHGIKYSTICGYARGYQKGRTWAFDIYRSCMFESYLDGVGIIRYNKYTRKEKHIWSYASGRNEKSQDSSACPCNKGASKKSEPPSFVGNDYYCESGTSINYPGVGRFYSQDPLWDGKGFNNLEGPCRKDMMPYFKRTYDSATTDSILVKLCRNFYATYRDVYLEGYGVFVK